MSSRKSSSKQKRKKTTRQESGVEKEKRTSSTSAVMKKLEVVLKCDTSGCTEAVTSSLKSLNLPDMEIQIISSGVGSINKSDVFMAETGSRLILGFNVGLMPHIDIMAGEQNVEIRLYEVIYKLIEDIETIGRSFVPQVTKEEITGTAKVIALFKSSRKGIIIGVEVLKGSLVLGSRFRILGAMGPMYVGTIESLHIEKDSVREARKGQQAGIKIRDFNKVKTGDLVECFRAGSEKRVTPWQPSPTVFYP
jgi:translation initiation factor IF-2